jgi:hypothetical protein
VSFCSARGQVADSPVSASGQSAIPRQPCPDRVSEVHFRCFERRTVHTTVADFWSSFFSSVQNQPRALFFVSFCRRTVRQFLVDSPLLCSRPGSECFPDSVYLELWLADSPTLVSDSPAAQPRTVCRLSPDSPGVHRKCCFHSLLWGFVSITSQVFSSVLKTSLEVSYYVLARVSHDFGVICIFGL